MRVSIGKIRVDNNDGTWTEMSFEMPHKVADDILCQIVDWKDTYEMTYLQFKQYDQEMSKFRLLTESKSENNPPQDEVNHSVNESK